MSLAGSNWTNSGSIVTQGGSVSLAGSDWTNSGSIDTQGGSVSLAGSDWTNSGSLQALNDVSLSLNGSWTNSGSIAVEGGNVNLNGAGSLSAGSSITGTGFADINGATIAVTGPSTVANLALDSGTLIGAGNLTITSEFDMSGGTLDGTGSTILAAGAQMNLDGGPDGNNQFTIDGGPIDSTAAGAAVNWTGGYLSGIVAIQGTFNINSNQIPELDAGTINLSGTGVWSGTGDVVMTDGSVFNNLAGSMFTIENDTLWHDGGEGPASAFNNAGTLIKTVTAGSTTFDVAFNNSGTVDVQSGTLILGSGGTINAGATFTGPGFTHVDGGTMTVSGPANAANLGLDAGTLTEAGDLTITSEFDMSGGTLAGTGSTILAAGAQMNLEGGPESNNQLTVDGGPIDSTAAGTAVDWTGGYLSGMVDIQGTFNINSSQIPELDAGTINLSGPGASTWSGTGDVVMTDGSVFNNLAGSTFTIESDAFWHDGGVGAASAFNNAGTLIKTVTAGSTTFDVAFNNSGTVDVETGTLNLVDGSLSFAGLNVLVAQAATTIAVSGDLVGATTNVDRFKPLGTVLMDGAGTAAVPQRLEVMSQDLGPASAGFTDNFAYGTLALGSTTYVQLVDNAHNSSGSPPEALYANALVVPSGSTLDLNGLNVDVRADQIDGTVIGGTITKIQGGGARPRHPVAGSISAASEVDDWTFFGRASQDVTIVLNTGAAALTPPIQPYLNYAQVQLIDSDGNVLATATNSLAGEDITLAGIALPADGVYSVLVQVPSAQPSSTGNYGLTVWDATVHNFQANLNQTEYGQINSPFDTDQWTFSAQANTQIQFNLLGAASPFIEFGLSGPNGFIGFSGLSSSSDLITLPASGTYVLTAATSRVATSNYAFLLTQTSQTELTLGTPYQGSLVGSGQAQLFVFSSPSIEQLLINLQDSSTADQNEVYVEHGAAPTRSDYQYRFSNTGASQQVLVPSAAPGPGTSWSTATRSQPPPRRIR